MLILRLGVVQYISLILQVLREQSAEKGTLSGHISFDYVERGGPTKQISCTGQML